MKRRCEDFGQFLTFISRVPSFEACKTVQCSWTGNCGQNWYAKSASCEMHNCYFVDHSANTWKSVCNISKPTSMLWNKKVHFRCTSVLYFKYIMQKKKNHVSAKMYGACACVCGAFATQNSKIYDCFYRVGWFWIKQLKGKTELFVGESKYRLGWEDEFHCIMQRYATKEGKRWSRKTSTIILR